LKKLNKPEKSAEITGRNRGITGNRAKKRDHPAKDDVVVVPLARPFDDFGIIDADQGRV
jgi:hypothetical protein